MKAREQEILDAGLKLVENRISLVSWLKAIQDKPGESDIIKNQRKAVKNYITKNCTQILSECNDIDSQDVMMEIQQIENKFPQFLNPAIEKLFDESPVILNHYIKDKNLYDMKTGFKMWLLNINSNNENKIQALDKLTENVDIQDYLIQQLADKTSTVGSNFLIKRYASSNYLMGIFMKSENQLAADANKIHLLFAKDAEFKRNNKDKMNKEYQILLETYPLTLECLQELLTHNTLQNNKGFHDWIESKIMPPDERGKGLDLNQYIKDEIINTKKLCEDLGVVPKSLAQLKPNPDAILYELNLKIYPEKNKRLPMQNGETLTIGDLHGNQLKLLYLLLLHDVIDLPQAEYNELMVIFEKNADKLEKADIDRFHDIISQIKVIKNTDQNSIKLIGDMIADRSGNDYFTLSILNELNKNI